MRPVAVSVSNIIQLNTTSHRQTEHRAQTNSFFSEAITPLSLMIKSITNAIHVVMTLFSLYLNPGEYPPCPSMYHE